MATEQGLKNLAEILPLLRLSEDGNKIENYKDFEHSGKSAWYANNEDRINNLLNNISDGTYILRPKPQPTYRRFKDGAEFWEHRDRWIRTKNCNSENVYRVCDVSIDHVNFVGDEDNYSYQALFDYCEFVDNPFSDNPITEPCGVKE